MTTEKIHEMVLEQFGADFDEHAKDIADNGADAGWSGFIYYSDTVPFGQRIRTYARAELIELAEECGESSMFTMMSKWKCLEGFSADEIAEGWYSGENEGAHTAVMNALAWYALEETARDLVNA